MVSRPQLFEGDIEFHANPDKSITGGEDQRSDVWRGAILRCETASAILGRLGWLTAVAVIASIFMTLWMVVGWVASRNTGRTSNPGPVSACFRPSAIVVAATFFAYVWLKRMTSFSPWWLEVGGKFCLLIGPLLLATCTVILWLVIMDDLQTSASPGRNPDQTIRAKAKPSLANFAVCFLQCLILAFVGSYIFHQCTLYREGWPILGISLLGVCAALLLSILCLRKAMQGRGFGTLTSFAILAAILSIVWGRPPSFAPVPFCGRPMPMLYYLGGACVIGAFSWYLPLARWLLHSQLKDNSYYIRLQSGWQQLSTQLQGWNLSKIVKYAPIAYLTLALVLSRAIQAYAQIVALANASK